MPATYNGTALWLFTYAATMIDSLCTPGDHDRVRFTAYVARPGK
jgi:hypothetical protein